MDELFGILTEQLTLVLLGVFAVGALILAFLAARDRTSFRMAVRNVPRRRAQTALIVVGLMLATVLFSAAFTTGDPLTNSLRAQALQNIGRVDVVVKAKQPESESAVTFRPGAGVREAPEVRERYFNQDLAGKIRNRLSGVESVAGVTPLARETVPVTSQETDLSEPRVDVLGMDADSMNGFDTPKAASGSPLSVGDLKKNEVYVSQETAEGLGIGLGDEVEASLVRPAMKPKSERPSGPDSQRRSGTVQGPAGGPGTGSPAAAFGSGVRTQRAVVDGRPAASSAEARTAEATTEQRPPELKIAGIYESGANPASDASMVMPLGALQKLVGEEGRINEVLITHRGPTVEGGRYTSETVDEIKPVLSSNDLEADPVKRDAVDEADTRGEIFSTLFVLFGQFSVAAGDPRDWPPQSTELPKASPHWWWKGRPWAGRREPAP